MALSDRDRYGERFFIDPFIEGHNLLAMPRKILLLAAVIVVLLSLPFLARPADGTRSGVKIVEQPDKLRIEINGELFTEYHFQDAPHVYFYPLLGPGGAQMTRHWPMKEVEGEEHDHKHHRSLWFSHGAVNGVDFWSETDKSGKIVHEKFLEVSSGPDVGLIRSRNRWEDIQGKAVLH